MFNTSWEYIFPFKALKVEIVNANNFQFLFERVDGQHTVHIHRQYNFVSNKAYG